MKLGKDVGIDRCVRVDTVVHSKFKAGSIWDKEEENDMQSELSWWVFDSTQYAELEAWQKMHFQLAITILLWSVVMEYQQ